MGRERLEDLSYCIADLTSSKGDREGKEELVGAFQMAGRV